MRPLVAAGVILLGLGGAVWYTTLAPSRGEQVAPGGPGQVLVTATATGSGSWVRYAVSLKNVGGTDFSGDVLLIDMDQAEASPQLGAPLPNLSTRPRLPNAPVVSGQSAYKLHVTVPARKSRTLGVLAPERFNYVQVLVGGEVVQDGAVDRVASLPVAVLSDIETASRLISNLHFDRYTPRVSEFNSANGFPASVLQLAGYAAVVVDQFDTAALSAAQVQALRDFTGLGGTLVLTGGSGWRRTLAPLPAELLPLRPNATGQLPLAELSQLAGTPLTSANSLSAPAATGVLAPGARAVLSSPGGAPLVAELGYGDGKVVELAFDPAADPLATSSLGPLAWTEALARAFEQLPGAAPGASLLPGPDPGLTGLLPTIGDAPLPPPLVVAPLLLGYVLLVGVGSYWLLRRRRAPVLFWAMAPLMAGAFTAGFYLVGQTLQGSLQDRTVLVTKVGPGQTMSAIEYHRVLFLRRGEHLIDPDREALVAPLTLDTFRITGSTCERCTGQLQGLPQGSEHVLPGRHSVVQETGVVYGSVRVVATTIAGHQAGGMDAHLVVRGNRITGTVTNGSSRSLRHVTIFSHDGQNVFRSELAGAISGHGTAQVDSELRPAEPVQAAAGGRAGDVAAMVRAVGAAAITRSGQAVLVAESEAAPSRLTVDGEHPPSTAIALVQQTVSPEAVGGHLRDFERKRLASVAGDQRLGFLDVYDIGLPANPPAALKLSYSKQFGNDVEIYDWAARNWTLAGPPDNPAQDDLSTRLTPDQTRGGVVRVRLREPRLFQGSTLWVDPA